MPFQIVPVISGTYDEDRVLMDFFVMPQARLMNAFKTIIDKEETANILATKTVTTGLKQKSAVLKHFYGYDEPSIVTEFCISFGLINFMKEDFYVVKEVLGYNYVLILISF